MKNFSGAKIRRSLVLIIASWLVTLSVNGQTFELLHTFYYIEGSSSNPLMQGSDGNLYGSTLFGGTNNDGTLFKMTLDGEFTVLDVLSSKNGLIDSGPLFEGSDGNFYGASSWTDGSIFRMTRTGALTTLASFNYTNGSKPNSPLLRTSDGTIYGTTRYGGAIIDEYGDTGGTIFELTPNGTITTLVSFGMTNGSLPWFGLVQGRDGNFYGTTREGGNLSERYYGYGTVFKATPSGKLTTLAIFNVTNGFFPNVLVEANDGSFYGATGGGGNYNCGTIFRVTTNGTFTMVASFNGTNGSGPISLIQASDGNFYGVTSGGGVQDGGTLFKMTPDGTLTTLFDSFSYDYTYYAFINGRHPNSLIQASDGNLYGTTTDGGSQYNGTIFRIVLPSTLSFARSGNQIVLSWPTNASGFTLQSIADLNSSNWVDVAGLPAAVGGRFVVTNTISGSQRFYRLKK